MGYLLSTSSWNIQDSVGRKIGWGNLKLPHPTIRLSCLMLYRLFQYFITYFPIFSKSNKKQNLDNPEHMHPVQKEKESQIGSKRFDLNSHSGRYAPIFREK